MSRLVSLPMYAAPAEAVAVFWRGLRSHMRAAGLVDVSAYLAAPDDLAAHWLSPDLLLSQTCGYPLTTSLAGRVRYVGTPHYRAPGCTDAFYSSAVVVRAGDPAQRLADLKGRRVAVNGDTSQSGYHALRAAIAPLAGGRPFFAAVLTTGAHRASARAVRRGEADVAALDAVTLALLARDEPDEIEALRVLEWTQAAPGLPLVTAENTTAREIAALRQAFAAAAADPGLLEARAALLVDGFSVLPADAYVAISRRCEAADEAGYPEVR